MSPLMALLWVAVVAPLATGCSALVLLPRVALEARIAAAWLLGILGTGVALSVGSHADASAVRTAIFVACGLGIGIAGLGRWQRHGRAPQPAAGERASGWQSLLAGLVMLGVLAHLTAAWPEASERPITRGDEARIWVAQARARALASDDRALSVELGDPLRTAHGDYPPLFPEIIRAIMVLSDDPHSPLLRWPILIAGLVLVALLYGLLRAAVAPLAASLLVALVFLTEPWTALRGEGMPEAPLAAFLLAATAAFLAKERGSSVWFALALVGLVATKNEGRMQALALLGAAILCALIAREGRIGILFRVFASAVPALLLDRVLAAERATLGLKNDLFSASAARPDFFTVLRTEGPGRVGEVATWLARHVWADFAAGSWLLLSLVALVLGGRFLRIDARVRVVGLGLCAIAFGYTLIYLGTPQDLRWHLETSAVRIHAVLLPSAALLLAQGFAQIATQRSSPSSF